jgi:hypothetical protein
MSYVASFARFWWGFVVGDDWRLAAGIALSLGVTWLLERNGANVWWLLPVAIPLFLAGSLWIEIRRQKAT